MYTSCVFSLSFQPTPILRTPNLSARLQGQELKMTTFKNCTSLRNRLYRSRKTKKLKSSPRSLPIKSHSLPTAGHVLVSKNRAPACVSVWWKSWGTPVSSHFTSHCLWRKLTTLGCSKTPCTITQRKQDACWEIVLTPEYGWFSTSDKSLFLVGSGSIWLK